MAMENDFTSPLEEFIGATILGIGHLVNRICIKVEKPNKEIKMITLDIFTPNQASFFDIKVNRMRE
jgi:hypothetical protein